jgi:hypothetical protein
MKQNFQIPADHHLTRYETVSERSPTKKQCWMFQKTVKGKFYSKTFSDKKYGGSNEAYGAAKKYRNAFFVENSLAIPPVGDDTGLIRYNTVSSPTSRDARSWVVQIRHGGHQHKWTFPDKKYGSREASKSAAIEFRDKYIRENNIELERRYVKSEITGVHKTFSRGKSGNKKPYWQVSWFEAGKNRGKRFSVTKFGEDGARDRAVRFRKEVEDRIEEGTESPFVPPENRNTRIWRYMDFTKFVAMLDSNSLFFSHVDNLGDPYEGSYSKANTWMRKFVYASANESRSFDDVLKIIRGARADIFVSCWYMSDYESAAMWKLYAKTNEAVCIQTTYQKLREVMPDFVKIGTVSYVDYEKEWIPEGNIYHPFLYKRISFEHERELRAIVNSRVAKLSKGTRQVDGGIEVDIPLNKLIERVFVSPEAEKWLQELVSGVIGRYGANLEVKKSALGAKPLK